jgi:ferritin-like metal-binding protein YciE
MEMRSLKDLYVEQLQDLWSAESQILKALPKMISAASSKKLADAFRHHEKQTQTHVQRLEEVCEALGVSPKGKKCVGMEGLLKEGEELIKEKPSPEALDAGLISAAQHVEHYEMAGYGTVRTWATLLGYSDQAILLQYTLDEEKATDSELSVLAGAINVAAEAVA